MEQEAARGAPAAPCGRPGRAGAEGSTGEQSAAAAAPGGAEPGRTYPRPPAAPAAPWRPRSPAPAEPPAPAPEAGGSARPPARAGSASLESASSSTLSLYGNEGDTTSGSEAAAAATRCWQAGAGQDECPICTEPYDGQRHKQALLNCNHALCSACLRAIMEAAGSAEFGRVRCPMCRQKTPMLEWEICKLQEELLLLHAQPARGRAVPGAAALPPRRPGVAGALEHHFQVRFHTSRMFGCLPCVRYPLCLIRALGRLERRCRCCYLLLLAALLGAEMLSLLLIFLPIVLLVLLFLILDK